MDYAPAPLIILYSYLLDDILIYNFTIIILINIYFIQAVVHREISRYPGRPVADWPEVVFYAYNNISNSNL